MSKLKAPGHSGAPAPANQTDIVVGMHYQLLAYVCGAACIERVTDGKPRTFTAVVTGRPNKCRFAVVQRFPIHARLAPGGNYKVEQGVEPTGPIIVWDLFDKDLTEGRRTGPDGGMMPPPPIYMGSSAEGMIMKAMQLYDR